MIEIKHRFTGVVLFVVQAENLRGANLCADLSSANLRGANLRGANLRGANLSSADLSSADLASANLSSANLRGANLSSANLSSADLSSANLSSADLSSAKTDGETQWPHFQICPERGSFIAWKKTTKGVIRIRVPKDAQRTSSLIGRKCRASHVLVLGGTGVGGTGPNRKGLTYEKGQIVRADKFDSDPKRECTHGIHFFMTRAEAEEWSR